MEESGVELMSLRATYPTTPSSPLPSLVLDPEVFQGSKVPRLC